LDRLAGVKAMHTDSMLDVGAIKALVVAGWTGRIAADVEAHIAELEALGVARPKSVPIFYRNSASLLTTAASIQTVGENSSGEVEFVLYSLAGHLWLGIGSDHTDRKAETINVTLSKQICPKPVGPNLWLYEDIRPHWETLKLRSFVSGENGRRRLYQEGSVANMRPPEELIRLYTGGDRLPEGTAMFCGTFAAQGGVSYSNRFEMELEDSVLNRKLTHGYDIVRLPNEG
jgi:hypothetical protein